MRRRWIIGLVLVVVLISAQLGLWFMAAARMETLEQRWIAARQAQGWAVTTGEVERHGWPFAVALRLPSVLVTSPAQGGLVYDAQTVELRVSLFSPHHLTARITGSEHLRLAGLPPLSFLADRIEADVAIAPDAPTQEGDLTVAALRLDIPGAGTATVANLALHLAVPATAQGAAFHLDATEIYPPVGVSEAFDQGIAHVTLDGTLAGALPNLPPTAQGMTAWRDGGGSLAFRQFDVNWSHVTLRTSATLSLDKALQRTGTAQARITGQDEAVDALAKDGFITTRTAQAAKGILGLLSRPAEAGGSVVEVPLTLQDRSLQLGRIPLLRLPEIVWKDAS